MKKFLSVILLTVCAASVFCGCAGQDSDKAAKSETIAVEETEEEPVTEVPTEAPTEAATEAAPLTAEELAPADLLTYEIAINGKALTIPFDFSELKEFGYTIKEDDELEANSFTIGVYPENADGKSISVQLWNPTDVAKKYSECKVAELIYRPSEDYSLTLPGGLPFDGRATVEDIKAKYGEPKNIREGTGYTVLEYGVSFTHVEFMIYDDPQMKKNDSVTLQNMK